MDLAGMKMTVPWIPLIAGASAIGKTAPARGDWMTRWMRSAFPWMPIR